MSIPIESIWLMHEGGENNPHAEVVVYVQRDGVWYEAIREYANSPFSHCISEHGLVSEQCKPADWLNKSNTPEETGLYEVDQQ